MALRCTECGEDSTFENRRQARGHVKFKSGGAHGDAQELPSDWENLFEEVDTGNGSGSDDGSESSADGSGSSSSDDSKSSDSSGSSESDDGSSDSSSDRGTISKLLDTDLRELIRS